MSTYLVTWTIDIEDVDSPEEAAAQALEILRDPDNTATIFAVEDDAAGPGVPAQLIDAADYTD